MRRALPLAVLALAALPGAAAQGLSSLDLTLETAQPAAPGATFEVPGRVAYCYQASGAVAQTVALQARADEPWVRAALEPGSFQATTSGGSRCGTRDVTVTVTLGRDAPAFQPGEVLVQASTSGSGARSDEATLPVQATYWAELDVTQEAPARIQRGSDGRVTVVVAASANGGTRLEVTGGTPDGKLTVQGQVLTLGVGAGLDQVERRPITLTVASSPGTAVGPQDLPLRFVTLYALSPSERGEALDFQAGLEVVQASSAPGPGLALLALGALGAGLAARRRGS